MKKLILAMLLLCIFIPQAEALGPYIVLSQEKIRSLSNQELFNLYVRVKIENEASKTFFNESGFQPRDYQQYKTLLAYVVTLKLEILQRAGNASSAPSGIIASDSANTLEQAVAQAYESLNEPPEDASTSSENTHREDGQIDLAANVNHDPLSYSYQYNLPANHYQHARKFGYAPYYFSEASRSRYSYTGAEKGHYILGKTDTDWPWERLGPMSR